MLGRRAQALGALYRRLAADAALASKQQVERALRTGPHRAPLDLARDRVVLLFYEDFDQDRLLPGDRHVKRRLREVVHALRGAPQVTGFHVAFKNLKSALEGAGHEVRVNDFALARRNPSYPIGITGYPHILNGWALPNPAVLGPGLLDHPAMAPRLMEDPRFIRYISPCEWYRRLFARTYGEDRCVIWFAGIDIAEWPDFRGEPGEIDFVIYDKVRWNREELAAKLTEPVLAELRRRGLSTEMLRYGHHDHATFRAALRRARGMIFLAEHETQGLAYQEAMACGVPILAWDPGLWLDPIRFRFGSEDVPGSSVPYFDARCGDRFRDAGAFPGALDRFLQNRDSHDPRAYVLENLSKARSAELYLQHYAAAGAAAHRR